MHFLDPVGRGRTNWHVGYQDVVAIGRLFTTGRIPFERVVALAGPRVTRPRLVRTRLGASVDDLVRGELERGPCRVVSGSVLSGRQASGWGRHLGRQHLAVAVLAQEDTALHGRPGPMIPVESFERVMPLDLLPVPLLRALAIGDVDAAESLGCLELAEEDHALCTYVCPGKLDYGAHLRAVLDELGKGS
jgi:Na+-transporting NADH:ubiquinone oxidoreductase subunit A